MLVFDVVGEKEERAGRARRRPGVRPSTASSFPPPPFSYTPFSFVWVEENNI